MAARVEFGIDGWLDGFVLEKEWQLGQSARLNDTACEKFSWCQSFWKVIIWEVLLLVIDLA